MPLPTGPFPRAHHVGSFIRPDNLIKAREAVEQKKMPDAELKRIQEAAIRDVVKMQEDLGLKVVTDGEYNRGSWQRDFLLLVDGWAKDQDANTAFSQSVEPLPFHGMSAYPYPAGEHFPDDAEHQLYRKQFNTRPALHLLRPLTELLSEAK